MTKIGLKTSFSIKIDINISFSIKNRFSWRSAPIRLLRPFVRPGRAGPGPAILAKINFDMLIIFDWTNLTMCENIDGHVLKKKLCILYMYIHMCAFCA